MFTTEMKDTFFIKRSTWVEIHVCLQLIVDGLVLSFRSTWVEIHVCLQREENLLILISRSTWVEIHVCLQHYI